MEQSIKQALQNELIGAIKNHELVLYYQPQIHLATSQVHALEALIRWQHPQKGLLMPDKFLSVAEESGLIVRIGEWVLDEACRQNIAWHEEGLPLVID
jgi:EAL domain-containing protein (putative c-di-GMP-specific phosphodiesterase class I)